MGDMFSSHSDTQSTETKNQQVGVSGTGAAGASGSVTGSQSVGGIALGNSTGGVAVHVENLDPQAIKSAENIAIASLQGDTSLATASINASQQLGIAALQTLENQTTRQNKVVSDSVAAAQSIAASAAPQSAGAELSTLVAANQKQLLIVGGALVAIFIAYKFAK